MFFGYNREVKKGTLLAVGTSMNTKPLLDLVRFSLGPVPIFEIILY